MPHRLFFKISFSSVIYGLHWVTSNELYQVVPAQPINIKGEKIMTIRIKELPAKRVAVMEYHGDRMRLSDTLDKLITWAKAQPINLKPKAG